MSDSYPAGLPAAAPNDPLVPLGWDERRAVEFAALAVADALPARVVRVDRGSVLVCSRLGTHRAEPSRRLREDAAGAEALPTAGDWVALLPRPRHRTDEILSVLPRRSAFRRRDPGDRTAAQVVAANIDVACIVHSATKPNLRRLEREVAQVWESGAQPVVVLTKVDLVHDGEATAQRLAQAAPGVPVHLVSAVDGRGLEEIAAYATGDPVFAGIPGRAVFAGVPGGRTLAFIGASGVGKSTLANALLGEEALATHEVRRDQRGRHTTTARHLLAIPGGGAILDTPGIREVAVWDAEEGIERAFADVEALAERCRFRDCRHEREPGCAVVAAVGEGRLSGERLESLRRLEREVEHLRRKQDERARAEQRREIRVQSREWRERERGRGKDRWRS